MSVVVNLNAGAVCPICERGRLHTVGENIWHCSRKRCNSEFFFDREDDVTTLNVRDIPKPPLPSFIPAVRRPWNPAYRDVWATMTHRERQLSFIADMLIVGAFLCVIAWLAS